MAFIHGNVWLVWFHSEALEEPYVPTIAAEVGVRPSSVVLVLMLLNACDCDLTTLDLLVGAECEAAENNIVIVI